MLNARYLLLLAILLITSTASATEQFVVVVNNANPETLLKQALVKKIFLGKKSFWQDGHKITVLLQTEKDLHRNFTTTILDKTARQFKMYWRRELYSGTGIPPQQFSDDEAIKEEIAANPRAIGYIHPDSLDDSVKRVIILQDSSAQH